MSREDLLRYYAMFLNPSYLKRDNYDPIGQFREDESVHQNCWHQGVQAGRSFGFFADGFYHNLVILKRRPQRTRRGLFNGTKPPVTADDGYLLSRLLDGIYESAKTGNQLDFRK